jgi:hypothetical protein
MINSQHSTENPNPLVQLNPGETQEECHQKTKEQQLVKILSKRYFRNIQMIFRKCKETQVMRFLHLQRWELNNKLWF